MECIVNTVRNDPVYSLSGKTFIAFGAVNVLLFFAFEWGNKMLFLLVMVVGIIMLIWGAGRFVEGASSLAQKMGVSSLIIGLTVVSFGTSAPELAVSVTASIKGANALCVSNVIGSNMFNLIMILGVSALITPLVIDKLLLNRELLISLGATVLLTVFMAVDNNISRLEGIVLLALFIAVLVMQIKTAKSGAEEDHTSARKLKKSTIIIYILTGLACIICGGQLTVISATEIAKKIGISQSLIGLTVVAVGTSLPELVTSLVAAKKGQNGIAMGNVVGSNLFNILFILGTSCAISPAKVEFNCIVDALILIAFTVATFIIFRFIRFNKFFGALYTLSYCSYMVFACIR